jgi:hypothetical protein
VVDVVSSMLEKGRSDGRGMVGHLIAVELAWLNTSHPNFIGVGRNDFPNE